MMPCLFRLLFVAAIAVLAWVQAGCARSQAEPHPEPDHLHTPACTFKEGQGLQLSPPAARTIALQTREVGADAGRLTVPASAHLRTIKGDFVYVGNGDWFLRTPVVIAGTHGDSVTVADGLFEGDVVVVQGVQDLWLAELQAVNGGVGCADGH